jgi:hypothetical protein
MLDNNDLNKIAELIENIFEDKLEKKLEDKLETKLDEKLEKKLEEKFKEHNEEMAAIINQAFQEHQDWVKEELDKKPSRYEILGYVEKKTEPLEMDMDKVKYIHRDEWKSLPNQRKISESLAADGLK